MKNKTVHRIKDRKTGTFTTVSLNLLRNEKLSSDARFLLIQVLSDSDEFRFSPSLYANRMKCTNKHIYNKIDELIEHGYVKKKPISKDLFIKGLKKKGSDKLLYHYTFSEFGNLKKSDENTDSVPSIQLNEVNKEDVTAILNAIENDDFIKATGDKIFWDDIPEFDSNKSQFDELIKRLDKELPKVKKTYIDEVEKSLKDYQSDKYPNSVKKKMKEQIKKVVYDENRLFKQSQYSGALNEAQNYWNTLKGKYNKTQYTKKTDYETLRHDQAEDYNGN